MNNIEEELRISSYQPVVGFKGTPIGTIFNIWIKKYANGNIYLLCSLVYGLGKIHGKREERRK